MSYRVTAPRNPVPCQDSFLLKDLKGPVETFSPEAVACSSSKDIHGYGGKLLLPQSPLALRLREFHGFGHEYELAATKPHCGAEGEECRGLKILLHYEVDACTEPEGKDGSLLASLSALSIGTREVSTHSNNSASSTCFRMKSSMIKIKTRAAHKELDWKEFYPQLYLSQAFHLYLAKHTCGTFGQVEDFQINSQGMAAHARNAEVAMAKLVTLLSDILKAIQKHGKGVPLSLVYRAGKLQLYKHREVTRQAFGKDISSKFQHTAAT
ncbi:hypothetical protein EDC04DRAFT_2602443 [Pisolithus marmoratus]|nr:hypothetical protein EDC04DRAFT_2602443 [Pisolithus marmoratus]